ncbi:hypothetical protein O181_085440 [Austropuccinia psidii MF-1]|uniref:Uncharacterized protein n=1 Tax=Austropuccinia psidii MF-1 TaxID=1389203 RepID=A0A9Q3IMX2_9BASI|nr:hypothetical protein [Austropuccinia psidii MF-1]
MYVSYHQDDWNNWLPLSKFSYNKSAYSSTKQSLFFTVYGRDPQFDSAHITQDTPAGRLSTEIQSVQQDVKRELEVAISPFKRTSNQPDPPKNCLKDGWVVFQSRRKSVLMLSTSSVHLNGNPSTQSSIFHF